MQVFNNTLLSFLLYLLILASSSPLLILHLFPSSFSSFYFVLLFFTFYFLFFLLCLFFTCLPPLYFILFIHLLQRLHGQNQKHTWISSSIMKFVYVKKNIILFTGVAPCLAWTGGQHIVHNGCPPPLTSLSVQTWRSPCLFI